MTTTNQASLDASMTRPTLAQQSLVIVGATGMVGGYVLRYALDNSEVKSVTSIGRKKLGISHPKLKEVLHQNFADCSPLASVLSNQYAMVYCLGRTPGRYRTSNRVS
jgi:putative NADH-flavin reductase